MVGSSTKIHNASTAKTADALSVLVAVDKYKNLSTPLAILVFALSAATSVIFSFYAIEISIKIGLDQIDSVLPAFVSYICLFVFWITLFFAALSLLQVAGFRDIRSAARFQLMGLSLSADELHSLRGAISRRKWQHARLIKCTVDGLAENT